MEAIFIAVGAVVLIFGFVVLYGAPYLPTLAPQIDIALELVDLKDGQHLLELGCGDGRVLIAAAEKGIQVTGYELNPILALLAWLRTRKYNGQVKIVWGNFWRHKMPPMDGIFVFLLPRYMEKLDKKIVHDMELWSSVASESSENPANPVVSFREPLGQEAGRLGQPKADRAKVYNGVKLVSFAFKIPDKEIAAQKEGVFLYHYQPASKSRTYQLPY
jgi:SAM-dependent methyltransferase